MNAFKHGLCAEKYDQRLMQGAHANDRRVLAHVRDLVAAYRADGLSRTRRQHLVYQTGLVVLTTWYALCHAISEE